MSSVPDRIAAYFFAPAAPATLAFARIVVFGLVLWKSLSRAWYTLPDWPAAFLVRTAAPGLPYVDEAAVAGLTSALASSAALGLLGIGTRWCAAVCFVVLYLFAAVDGGIWDSGWVLVSFLLLLACSRSDDALSVTSLRRRSGSAAPPSWEYRWPIRLIQLSLVLVYFESGVAKLARTGWSWLRPETLQDWYFFHLWVDTHRFPYGSLLVEHPQLALAAGATTLALELGVVVLPIFERAKWLLVPALALMHVAIGATLNIWFTEYFFLLLLFFDWDGVFNAVLRRTRRTVTTSAGAASGARAPAGERASPCP